MRRHARWVRLSASQSQRGVAPCRVTQHTNAWAFRVFGNSVCPLRVFEQCINHAGHLPGPLREVVCRAGLQQAAVLPVVPGVAQRSHQVAVLGQCLGQAGVAQLGAACAVADDDQAFEAGLGRALNGDIDGERTHGDLPRRRLGGVVQSDWNGRSAWRDARHVQLTPTGLAGQRLRGDEQTKENHARRAWERKYSWAHDGLPRVWWFLNVINRHTG